MRLGLILAPFAGTVRAGIVACGVYQAGCTILVISCYGAEGPIFGVPTPGVQPAAILACSATQGVW